MPDPDSVGTALVGLGILVTSAYGGWQSVQARRRSEQAESEARRAADNSHPIGNGWGTELRADVARIAVAVDRIDRRQTTSDERAAVLEREVREANQHARTAAEQSSAAAAGLAAHLADHSRDHLTERTS